MWWAVPLKAWTSYCTPAVRQHFFQLPICQTIWVTVRIFFLCTNPQLDWQMLFIMEKARTSLLYPLLFVIHKRFLWYMCKSRTFSSSSWLCVKTSTRSKSFMTYQVGVSFSCVCHVIDNEFRHNIVKVAADSRGDRQLSNCRIARSRSLTRRMNFKFMCLSAYWQ